MPCLSFLNVTILLFLLGVTDYEKTPFVIAHWPNTYRKLWQLANSTMIRFTIVNVGPNSWILGMPVF